jgi:hypothetical protein
MMRIEGPSRRPPVGGKSDIRGSGAGRPLFQIGEGPVASQTHAAHATNAPTELDAILALQAVEDPLFAKRKTVRRGRSLLDHLEALKADVVLGKVSEARLDRMLFLVRQAKEQVNPELDALIEDIELRVLVELAKFGKFVS